MTSVDPDPETYFFPCAGLHPEKCLALCEAPKWMRRQARYLQVLAGSVAVALLLEEGFVVPPASRRAQSLASPPDAPEFCPFMFVLLPFAPLPLLPVLCPLLPEPPLPVSLELPELPEPPVPPFPDPPDDWARADVATPSEIKDTASIFVNMLFPPLSFSPLGNLYVGWLFHAGVETL